MPAHRGGSAWSRVVGVGVGAVLLSCAPEIGPPTWPDLSASDSYADPEATPRSIERAIATRQQGVSRYLAAFADSTDSGTPAYHQAFDPADVTFFQSACQCQAPADWGRAQEQVFRHESPPFQTTDLSRSLAKSWEAEVASVRLGVGIRM